MRPRLLQESIEAGIKEALQRSAGRAFVLFTSFKHLGELSLRLKDWIEAQGWLFLRNGRRRSQPRAPPGALPQLGQGRALWGGQLLGRRGCARRRPLLRDHHAPAFQRAGYAPGKSQGQARGRSRRQRLQRPFPARGHFAPQTGLWPPGPATARTGAALCCWTPACFRPAMQQGLLKGLARPGSLLMAWSRKHILEAILGGGIERHFQRLGRCFGYRARALPFAC